MAVPAYYQWVAAGRPLEPAQPIREFVERMRAAYPLAVFSWYADEAHYTAEPPQDHTPYSATGWPLVSPRWVVFATDVMNEPAKGVDCSALFGYWIGEARAGRMPWLKYLIWRARRYDVRNGWEPVAATGHYDHVHLSARTDHQHTTLGAWSPAPEGHDMTPAQETQLLTEVHDIWYALFKSTGPTRPAPSLIARVVAIGADVAEPDELAPEQLAAVTAAAGEGAAAGVDAALDGATLTTTIDTPESP